MSRLAEVAGIDLSPPPEVPEIETIAPPTGGPPVEVFFPVGQRHGVRPGDLVGALANEAGLPTDALGRITIEHRKSFVGMPAELAEHLLATHPVLVIRNQEARLALARPGPRDRPRPKRSFKGRRPPRRR